MSDASPAPLNDADQAVLRAISLRMSATLAGLFSESMLWSAYVVLFTYALRVQIKKRPFSLPAMFILGTTIILFISSSAIWSINMSAFFIVFLGTFSKNVDLDLASRYMALAQPTQAKFILPCEFLWLMNMLIADSVVIWRAWAIWKTSRKGRLLVLLPIVTLVVCFCFDVVTMDCLAKDKRATAIGSQLCEWAEPVAWASSLLTNVVSTVLIAIRAWSVTIAGYGSPNVNTHLAYRQHRRYIRESAIKSKGTKVLILLVESGLVYCIFWAVQVIIFFQPPADSALNYARLTLGGMNDQVSGIYPTIIIVLVSLQQSIQNHTREGMISFHIDSHHQVSAIPQLYDPSGMLETGAGSAVHRAGAPAVAEVVLKNSAHAGSSRSTIERESTVSSTA
ncbi:hypothetical protein CYLTODRAFT_494396 [Cylindrobasidium torrendii FP15055 ss-10]|uniref:Family A G protein-coupled receptor-like protein n=1 Tax=Cylindrobasidium torrendii FP15055 ss-10 TaxID=1314674 RepID=A0A0D7AWR5_9AGAR|nr:hypothetical protein CYLTODRAFT_494396 [Cylindrobasidium torrendii FP15055 ss-10]